MTPFTRLDGLVVPLDRADVDTDALIPKQFMKLVARTGFGEHLFDAWRFLDPGYPGKPRAQRQPNPEFVLNQPRYQGAQILLARSNFGCGSSREHALWALVDHGIRAVIAPSFADIFFDNCFKNGVLPVRLTAAEVDRLFEAVAQQPGFRLHIDLPAQCIAVPQGPSLLFDIDGPRKAALLHGLDDIAITLQHADAIRRHEARTQVQAPWLLA